MTLTEQYKLYRQRGKDLCGKVIRESLESDAVFGAGKRLGIVIAEKTFVFESRGQTDVFMDFALNEYLVDGKNAMQVYRDKVGAEDKIEQELLSAYLASYTSLFCVVSTSPVENSLLLTDLLNVPQNIQLMDIGFSHSARPGLLLFTRVVPLPGFNMTSGLALIFPEDLDNYLLQQYKRLRKKIQAETDSMKRFLAFFKLNKTEGLEVEYA